MEPIKSRNPAMVKIKTYRVSRKGCRGLVVTLPKVWAEDNRLQSGDRLNLFRDTEDRLIITVAKRTRAARRAEPAAAEVRG